MHMAGEQRIAAPRQRVWEALNDPEVLRASIPGCQTLEKQGDDRFLATAEVKIGPIGARFKGDVSLTDLDPAEGYTIVGQGSGGIAGSAKGSARVRLSDDGTGTLIRYAVEAEVGGRMAQLGGPIIDATAKNLAGKFFARFGEIVANGTPAPAPATATATAPAPATAPGSGAGAGAPVDAPIPVPPPVPLHLQAEPQPASHPAPRPAPLWGWVAALIAALLAGYLAGTLGVPGTFLFGFMILLVVTAAAAYAAGRYAGGTRA